MKRSMAIWLLGLIGVVAFQAGGAPPNIILILMDDMGCSDLSCYGSTYFDTPNIDRLAAEGMRFTAAYSACTVCSPTRASVMTGKYPARLHITDWIPGTRLPASAKLAPPPDWQKQLPLEETIIPEALKPAGYATAHIGKWHLGAPEFFPDKAGFDINIGGCDRGQPPSYFSPYRIATISNGPDGEFLTDRESSEACKFIETNKDKPFFLNLWHYAVHTPLQAKKEIIQKYQAKTPTNGQNNSTYAAMIESVDQSFGKISAKLRELGLEEKTVIIFTSDNGGLLRVVGNNIGVRAGKGSAYEGGVRVPWIVKWPGVAKAGSICAEPVISVDIYPTILELTGASGDAAHNRNVDGLSIVPLLRNPAAKLPREVIYWHYPHYHPGGATPYSAVRTRDWRLVEFYEDQHVEMYNLKDDPMESQDLAAAQPAKAKELRDNLHAWRNRVQAQPPVTRKSDQ